MRNVTRTCLAATSLLLGLAGLALAASPEIKIGADRRIRISDDWRFFKGEADGAEQIAFSDAAWRPLDLPHDWAIEGPFDRKFNPHDGGLPFFGVAWYRKHFTLPAAAKGKYFSVQFDGAMSNSTVWINGNEDGRTSLRLRELRTGSDALPQIRRGERAGRPARARRPTLRAGIPAPASTATCGSTSPDRCMWRIGAPTSPRRTVTDAKARRSSHRSRESRVRGSAQSRWRPPSSMPRANTPAGH